MESKNTKKNNNLSLALYNLKEKKNWFLVSIIIMTVTLIIMPMVLNSGMNEGIIVIGMLEIGTLLFINALIDFSFFHENRKLTYYNSKPVTRMERINSLILSNVTYLGVLLMFLLAIGFFANIINEPVEQMFIVAVPWLLIGIFIVALSSILTGNTIAAGIASIINFTLPLSVLAIIYYCFEVIGHFALGFNPRILFNSFLENIYRIDLLYFIKYIEESFTLDYFLVLGAWLVVLYGLIIYTIKRRKNERTGEFVVSDGYKNTISILMASLVPIGFSEVFYNTSIASRIFSFIILSGLTYYLINAILEKSFRIRKYALKLFVAFILFFGIFVFGTSVAASSFETKVPKAEEINAVYFEQNSYIWSEDSREVWDINNVTQEEIEKNSRAFLYKDPENIKEIIEFHKAVIENQEYYNYSDFNLVYFYNNGDRLYRYYTLTENKNYNKDKDVYLKNIVNSLEFKVKKLPFIYDDAYFNSLKTTDIIISTGNGVTIRNADLQVLRGKLRMDYNNLLNTSNYSLNHIVQDRHGYFFGMATEESQGMPIFYINMESTGFTITKEFRETFDYLKKLMDNGDVPESFLRNDILVMEI